MASPRRLQWRFTANPIYFVTACTKNRALILDRPDVYEALIRFALQAPERGICVGRYVIMPDHMHLFVKAGPGAPSLSLWMKSLKNAISKTLRMADFPQPHWQKGFFDHVIRSNESYAQKWLYVRENPVRAGLVHAAEEWPYAGEIGQLELLDE